MKSTPTKHVYCIYNTHIRQNGSFNIGLLLLFVGCFYLLCTPFVLYMCTFFSFLLCWMLILRLIFAFRTTDSVLLLLFGFSFAILFIFIFLLANGRKTAAWLWFFFLPLCAAVWVIVCIFVRCDLLFVIVNVLFSDCHQQHGTPNKNKQNDEKKIYTANLY